MAKGLVMESKSNGAHKIISGCYIRPFGSLGDDMVFVMFIIKYRPVCC